jgi:hypothetical protein
VASHVPPGFSLPGPSPEVVPPFSIQVRKYRWESPLVEFWYPSPRGEALGQGTRPAMGEHVAHGLRHSRSPALHRTGERPSRATVRTRRSPSQGEHGAGATLSLTMDYTGTTSLESPMEPDRDSVRRSLSSGKVSPRRRIYSGVIRYIIYLLYIIIHAKITQGYG